MNMNQSLFDNSPNQEAKEEANKLGIKQGMSLVHRGRRVIGIFPDEREVVVSESEREDDVWRDAVNELKKNVDEQTVKYEELQIFTDGGSRGNPGPSASGYVILTTNDEVLEEGGEYLGITTNNQAEYQAVKLALEAASRYKVKSLDFYLDSLLVVNQLNGKFKVKNRDLWPIHEEIKRLCTRFSKVKFTHVRREFNKLADAQVNIVLDTHEGR